MKIIILALLVLTFPQSMLSQASHPRPPANAKNVPAKKAEAPATGELTGFVFAITKAGDLKPARLATVVLLWSPVARDAETLNSAGAEYTHNSVKQMLRAFEQVKQLRADKTFGENACRTVLAGHIVALSDTVDWVAAQRKSDFNKNIYADEEGRFKITGIPEGRYTLVVSGQAGLYNAFWEKEEVVITAGQTTEVKL